jgi:hypothetical protein
MSIRKGEQRLMARWFMDWRINHIVQRYLGTKYIAHSLWASVTVTKLAKADDS